MLDLNLIKQAEQALPRNWILPTDSVDDQRWQGSNTKDARDPPSTLKT